MFYIKNLSAQKELIIDHFYYLNPSKLPVFFLIKTFKSSFNFFNFFINIF